MKSKHAYFGPFLKLFWCPSIFKVYNQTLRKMGDNDLSVEYSGVKKRQRAGSLERVVKCGKEVFHKAWAWMASNPSDSVTARTIDRIFCRHFLSPRDPQVSWF